MTHLIAQTGLLIWPLLLLSLLGLSLIIDRCLFFIRLKKPYESPVLLELKETLTSNKKAEKNTRDELVSYMLEQIRERYYFGIRMLRLVAVISPMLGLLGTVLGIIESFKAIADLSGPVYPSIIADGLWTAMMTTAIGLIIALPCLFFTFFFARLAEKRIHIYEQELNKLSLEIEGINL
jgi:biopolymer transport protein ExbB